MCVRTKTFIYLLTVVLGTNSEPPLLTPLTINVYNKGCSSQPVITTNVPSCNCPKNDWFTIQSTTGGDLILDASEPNEIKLQHFTGSETQLWKFEGTDRPGTYNIINKKTGDALDIDPYGKPFKPVITKGKSGSLTQQWITNFNGRLRNAATNLNLDVAGAKFEPGTRLILWDENGNKAQEFVLQKK